MPFAVVFFADGFEEVEAITCVDMLRRAKINVHTVSIMGKNEVIGAHNIPIICDYLFDEVILDIKKADALILPGGLDGTNALKAHSGVKLLLQDFYKKGKLTCAVCAAPTVLAVSDILYGKNATCYPGCEDELEQNGATVCEQEVVIDGQVITSKSAGTTAKFAKAIIEALVDKDTADEVYDQMIY